MRFTISVAAVVIAISTLVSADLDLTKKNNVVVYWDQNAIHNLDPTGARDQKRLVEYCKSTDVDVIPIGFLNAFSGLGGQPEVNFSNACGFYTFIGSDLNYCPEISDDIIACQTTYKKKILLSIGGDSDKYGGWATTAEAQAFGDRIWDMFGKGWSYYRPFGKAIVDGFDLDLERGPSTGYDQFAYRLRKLMDADKKATGKQWLLTAAPQCPLPDSIMDLALTKVSFDALFVQFYNNPNCAVDKWVKGKDQSTNAGFNFGMWDTWAKTKSFNKNVKIFLTIPMHPTAAGSGYISKDQALKVINDIAPKYSSFAGVAAWDASYAWANSAYLPAVKKTLNTLASVTPVKRDLRHNHHHRSLTR